MNYLEQQAIEILDDLDKQLSLLPAECDLAKELGFMRAQVAETEAIERITTSLRLNPGQLDFDLSAPIPGKADHGR